MEAASERLGDYLVSCRRAQVIPSLRADGLGHGMDATVSHAHINNVAVQRLWQSRIALSWIRLKLLKTGIRENRCPLRSPGISPSAWGNATNLEAFGNHHCVGGSVREIR